MPGEFLKSVCRTCLLTEEEQLFDWNTKDFVEGFNFAKCFQECTQLELLPELPQMLCFDCSFELRITHSFLKKARKSDQRLRSYLEKKAPSMSHTVDMEKIAQSTILRRSETGDLIENIADNSTHLEHSPESTTHDSIRHLKSHESDLVLGDHPAEQNLPYEKENQNQSTEYSTEKSIEFMQVGDVADPVFCCDLAEDSTIDSDSGKDILNEKKTDDLEVTLDYPENVSRTASNKKRETDYICKICGSAYTTMAKLRQHQVSRHERPNQRVKPIHQCAVCKEIFDTKSTLTHHMDSTHGDQKWLCCICSGLFKSKAILKKHEATHEKRVRKYSCDVCGVKCLTQTILRGHMKVHEKNRQPEFACDECEKTFFVRGGLILHKKLHSGDTVNCAVCQRAFPRAVDLKVHMRSHSNERPYKCEICESTFKTTSQLKLHVLKHKGIQYKCDVCDKTFIDKTTLSSHKKVHSGSTHKCQICEKEFYSKYKTLRHIKAVHSISSSEMAEESVVYLKMDKAYLRRQRFIFK